MIGSLPKYYCTILFQKFEIVDTVLDIKIQPSFLAKTKNNSQKSQKIINKSSHSVSRIRMHGLKHTNKQGDQSFISILDYP